MIMFNKKKAIKAMVRTILIDIVYFAYVKRK